MAETNPLTLPPVGAGTPGSGLKDCTTRTDKRSPYHSELYWGRGPTTFIAPSGVMILGPTEEECSRRSEEGNPTRIEGGLMVRVRSAGRYLTSTLMRSMMLSWMNDGDSETPAR